MKVLERGLRSTWAAPLVAGVLHWAAFPPLDLGLLAPLAWAVLFASLRLRRGAAAFRQGLAFGVVLFVPGLQWIQPLVPAGWIFTAVWCALHEAVFLALVARFWLRREGDLPAGWVVGAPLLHLAVDGVRTHLMTGFPWLLVGYTGWRNPVLLDGAPLLGVHGATLAVLLTGAGLAEVLVRRIELRAGGARPLAPALIWWTALWIFGAAVAAPPTEPGPRLALLQGNIPQYLKERRLREGHGRTGVDEWMERHLRLIDEAHARAEEAGTPIDAVVWPETMYPPALALHDLAESPGVWQEAARLSGGSRWDAIHRRTQSLVGIITRDLDGARWNSMVLVDAEGRPLGIQDKMHLTPGGEYIPLIDVVPFRDTLERALRRKAGFLPDLTAGDHVELLPVRHDGGAARCGVLICYESIFPELARERVQAGADFLLNASNYGWFEGTALMTQTEAMACFRAAELRVPVVLSSNNGPSVVIGPDGRPGRAVTDSEGRRTDVAGVVVEPVPLLRAAPTAAQAPFRVWGETPAWLLGAIGLLLGLRARRDLRDGESS